MNLYVLPATLPILLILALLVGLNWPAYKVMPKCPLVLLSSFPQVF